MKNRITLLLVLLAVVVSGAAVLYAQAKPSLSAYVKQRMGGGAGVAGASNVDLTKMATDVQGAIGNHVATVDCKTVCEVQVTIGPDGKPVPTVVCRLVCGM